MTKDVLVSISGLHTDVMQEAEEENEAIEVVNPANYYFRNGVPLEPMFLATPCPNSYW